MDKKMNGIALGYSLALIAAIHMLLLGILGNFGLYMGAVEMMQNWHLFFDLSVVGIITGIVEGAIWSFVFGWLIAYFYNKFA